MTPNGVVRSKQVNAAAGWVLIAMLCLVAGWSIVTGSTLWAIFVTAIAAVAALPALVMGIRTAMVPWPILAIAVVAGAARLAGVFLETAGYLGIVALALIVVIELDVFTSVELSRRFAVVFSVLLTMALEGVWIVAQYLSDAWLGTGFLRTQVELQWDIVLVTLVAVVVGTLYQVYATRFEPAGTLSVTAGQHAR